MNCPCVYTLNLILAFRILTFEFDVMASSPLDGPNFNSYLLCAYCALNVNLVKVRWISGCIICFMALNGRIPKLIYPRTVSKYTRHSKAALREAHRDQIIG